MPVSSLGTGYTFTATNLASGPINAVAGSMGKLGAASSAAQMQYDNAMKSIKRGAMELGAGVLGLGLINRLSKDYGKFEYQLVSAGTIMRATAGEMDQLKRAAIDAGIATQFSPVEAAKGLEQLGAAGMNAAQSMKTLNPVLGLAAASMGQLGVGEAAANVVGVLNAFGESADNAGKRVDQLVRITQMSNFQARDFSIAISNAAAQASAANQTFESMTATLGLLRNTNLDASTAATSYREAVRRVAGDTRALDKLKKLGITTLDAETNKIKDLAQIITELHPKLQTLNAQEQNLALKVIFGVRGMKTYNAVIAGYNKLVKEGVVGVGDYAGAHRRLVEGLDNAEGTMAKTRDALLETSEGQRILLKGSIETFKVMAGQTLTPVLIPALKSAISTLNMLIKVLDVIPKPMRGFLSSVAGVGLAMLTLRGSIRMISGIRGLLGMKAAQAAATAETIKATAASNAHTVALTREQAAMTQATFAGYNMSAAQAATPKVGLGARMGMGIRRAGGAVAGAGRRAMGALTSGAGMMGMMVGFGFISYANEQAKAENRRAQAIEESHRRIREAYEKTAESAMRMGIIAGKAAQKLVDAARAGSIQTIRQSILDLQSSMEKRIDLIKKAEEKINKLILKRRDETLSEEEQMKNDARIKDLRADAVKQRKGLQHEKVALIELEGMNAARMLRYTKGEGERDVLRKKIARGYLATEQKRLDTETLLRKKAGERRNVGLGDLAKQAEKKVAISEKTRLRERSRVIGLLGLSGLAPEKQEAELKRLGAGTLAAVKAVPGAQIEKDIKSEIALGKAKVTMRDKELGALPEEMATGAMGGIEDIFGMVGIKRKRITAQQAGLAGAAEAMTRQATVRLTREDLNQFAQILARSMKLVNITVPITIDETEVASGTNRDTKRKATEGGAPQAPSA